MISALTNLIGFDTFMDETRPRKHRRCYSLSLIALLSIGLKHFGPPEIQQSLQKTEWDFSAKPSSPLLQRVATFYWLAFNTATTQQRALLLSRVLDSNPKCMEISVSL